VIDLVIEMLKDSNFSYNDIIKKTGLSLTHIYNINIGARRKQDNIVYPIRPKNTKGTRGLKFSPEEAEQIQLELQNTSKTYAKIAEEWECTSDCIRKINMGKIQAYRNDNKFTYPIRPIRKKT
jgi:DNA invertase Pin-like site-specific DNA recombinase